jgi:zinc metalloprotease ZmpB
MNQEFDLVRNVYLDLDSKGIVRQLLHTHAPVAIQAATPQIAAATYLKQFGDLLGLTSEQLKNLSLSPSTNIENAPIEYRFLKEKHQFDSATVAYYQTDLGIPVWEAGVAVQIKLNPFRILSSQSTRHPDLKVKAPSRNKVKQAESMTEAELARLLGLQSKSRGGFVADRKSLKIESRGLFIYRYESAKRVPATPPPPQPPIGIAGREQEPTFAPELPTLPLPPVADGIREGQHYVCARIDFALAGRTRGLLHWVALIEVDSLSVLYLRAFTDNVNGMVFERDPVTDNGGPLPTANSAALNPVRVSDVLPGLAAPVGGTQSLAGENVTVADGEAPTVAPPTEPAGTDFNFDSRTDNFAAVNAYYHCDKFFRLLDGMGFTQAGYFGGTTFPTTVDHRGHYGTTDGIEVNAHCDGNAGGNGIGLTGFCLADTGDTTNPIGIACDYRVVLHELGGHGVLYNHVNKANLGFSHSAGDSVAAILNDPGSQAADRFQTFPWVFSTINRRHDRPVTGGWGWGGVNDLNGYSTEQILATTHFNIYRSLGGDSADLAARQFASRMAVYLILRAIATLTPATNPANVSGWVTALMTADAGDWVTENLTGGAYNKVIRWAFEKQGLYQPAGAPTPTTNAGAPPAVDVYMDDGRTGEYQYQPNWWSCQSIWNRLHNDGGTAHEEPVTNQTNYVYVKIKNRGTQNATNVVVKAFHANPAAGLSYPIDWFPMNTAQLAAADVPANNAGEITVGPFAWVPTHVGHECLFMIVSATGDTSNVDNIAAGDSIPEWRLVPNDNNIGQRNVYPIAGSGTSGLTADFNRLSFELKNPHLTTAAMEVRAVLPSFLEERGWKIQYLNRGGASFPLPSGASRNMVIRLIPGADFSPTDVAASPDKTIHLYGYAGGILVGGMSYEVDPKLKASGGNGGHHGSECTKLGEELIKCVELSRQKVCKVRIRKVNVDLEIEDECDECSD